MCKYACSGSSALAVKACRQISPEAKIGCMIAGAATYAMTCNPSDAWEDLEKDLVSLFFADVQARGYYPSYSKKLFKENNVVIKMEDGDEEILRQQLGAY